MKAEAAERAIDDRKSPRTVPFPRVGALVAVPQLLRQLGADPGAVLIAAGLDPDALAEAEARVPFPAVGRLLRDAAISSQCAYFGLLAGRAWHLSDLGVL